MSPHIHLQLLCSVDNGIVLEMQTQANTNIQLGSGFITCSQAYKHNAILQTLITVEEESGWPTDEDFEASIITGA